MKRLIDYLKDSGYLQDNYLGKNFETPHYHLHMVINKYIINSSINDILPFKESWELIIQNNLITKVIRDDLTVFTLISEQAEKNKFIYKNNDSEIYMFIGEDPSNVTGTFYKLGNAQFTYKFWC